MAASIDLPISSPARTITLHVTGLRSWKFRLKVAQVFFWLGARIAGVGIIFESDDRPRSLVDQINEELADGKRLNL